MIATEVVNIVLWKLLMINLRVGTLYKKILDRNVYTRHYTVSQSQQDFGGNISKKSIQPASA